MRYNGGNYLGVLIFDIGAMTCILGSRCEVAMTKVETGTSTGRNWSDGYSGCHVFELQAMALFRGGRSKWSLGRQVAGASEANVGRYLGYWSL